MESSERVAAAVIDWFHASHVAQKKHAAAKREWTVLAGIVVLVGDEPARVLACGSGTKCLGRRDLDANGLVVNDCHAEIVARRALLRYLYSEALHHDETKSIFTRDAARKKLRLKPNHELHLFISEPPCGDAAIYPLREAVVEQLVTSRTQRETTTGTTTTTTEEHERSELRLTGAKQKRADGEDAATQDKRFAQAVGVARVKSGRSDLPLDKQTLSMSCSDKIALWTACGVQGSLLLAWFEPLVLTSIVVVEDPSSRSRGAQQHAMERALRDRITICHGKALQLYVLPQSAVTARFRLSRATYKTASPLSLNWTQQEPHWHGGGEATRWHASFFHSPDVEVVMAATGFKEGAQKASRMDATARQRVASRLSKWSLFRAYEAVRQASTTDTEPPARSYADEKAVVLGASGLSDRQRAKSELGEWVGVPASLKRFSPFVERDV